MKGYAFQVTLLNACVRAGAKTAEVPIAFAERTKGESKMRPTDMISGGFLIMKVRAKQIKKDVMA
jgi:hypothetical protein